MRLRHAVVLLMLVTLLSGCSELQIVDNAGQKEADPVKELTSAVKWTRRISEGSIANWILNDGLLAVLTYIPQSSTMPFSSYRVSDGSHRGSSELSRHAGYTPGLITESRDGKLVIWDEHIAAVAVDLATRPDLYGPSYCLMSGDLCYLLYRETNLNHVICQTLDGRHIWEVEIPDTSWGTETLLVNPQLALADENTLLAFGMGLDGLTAIDLATGLVNWSFVPPDGIAHFVTSVSPCAQGFFVTGWTNESSGGEATLLSTDGAVVWRALLPKPAFIAKTYVNEGRETFWCLAGVGEGIGAGGGNTLYQVADGEARVFMEKISYQGAYSLQVTERGIVCLGHEDGKVYIVHPGAETESISFASRGRFQNPTLFGVSGDAALIGINGGDKVSSVRDTIIAVDLQTR